MILNFYCRLVKSLNCLALHRGKRFLLSCRKVCGIIILLIWNLRSLPTVPLLDPAFFLQELEKVRQLGCAIDAEEQLTGVACVGAPVFNYTSNPCGAIWVSGPTGRFSNEVIKQVVPELLAVTRRISGIMGYIRE